MRWIVGLPLVLMCLLGIWLLSGFKWPGSADEESSREISARNIHFPPGPSVKPSASSASVKNYADQSRASQASHSLAPVPSVAKTETRTANPSPQDSPALANFRSSAALANREITGKVTLLGQPPAETPIPLDPSCGRQHTNGVTTHHFVVADDGGLANVFVYVKAGLPTQRVAATGEPVLLDQAGCEYTPHILGLQTGQSLLVRNSDPVLHNVHVTPALDGNREANKAQLPQSPSLVFAFAQPELFLRFKCDVHPWMFAYVCVVDHPWFTVTGADGSFRLPPLPPGRYVVEAVHRKAGAVAQEITVGAAGDIVASFQLQVPARP